MDPAALAASITALRDDSDCTVVKVAEGDTVRLIPDPAEQSPRPAPSAKMTCPLERDE